MTIKPLSTLLVVVFFFQKKVENRTPAYAKPFALTPVRRESRLQREGKLEERGEGEEGDGEKEMRRHLSPGEESPFHIDPHSVQTIFGYSEMQSQVCREIDT